MRGVPPRRPARGGPLGGESASGGATDDGEEPLEDARDAPTMKAMSEDETLDRVCVLGEW